MKGDECAPNAQAHVRAWSFDRSCIYMLFGRCSNVVRYANEHHVPTLTEACRCKCAKSASRSSLTTAPGLPKSEPDACGLPKEQYDRCMSPPVLRRRPRRGARTILTDHTPRLRDEAPTRPLVPRSTMSIPSSTTPTERDHRPSRRPR